MFTMSTRPGRIGPVQQEQALRRVRDTGLWIFNGEDGKSHEMVKIHRVGLFNWMQTKGHSSTCRNNRLNPTENTIRMGIRFIGQNGGCGHDLL